MHTYMCTIKLVRNLCVRESLSVIYVDIDIHIKIFFLYIYKEKIERVVGD